MNDKELRQSLKNENRTGVYFICGNEDYIKRICVDALLARFAPDGESSFDFKKLEGVGADVDSLVTAVQTVPFLSEYVTVLASDFPFDSLSEAEFEVLSEAVSDVPEQCVLIFWQLSAPVGKAQKQNAVMKLCEKVGTLVECNVKSDFDIEKIVAGGIRKRGCTVSDGVLSYLVDTVGSDLYLLLNEVEKLSAYKQGGEIKREDIDKLCVRSIEANAFDVTRAILAKNCERALHELDKLFALREEPLRILGAIVSTYADIYRAKVAVLSAGSCAPLENTFSCYKGKKSFRLKNAARNASNVPIEKLRQALDELDRADALMKTSNADGRMILQELTVRLVAI